MDQSFEENSSKYLQSANKSPPSTRPDDEVEDKIARGLRRLVWFWASITALGVFLFHFLTGPEFCPKTQDSILAGHSLSCHAHLMMFARSGVLLPILRRLIFYVMAVAAIAVGDLDVAASAILLGLGTSRPEPTQASRKLPTLESTAGRYLGPALLLPAF